MYGKQINYFVLVEEFDKLHQYLTKNGWGIALDESSTGSVATIKNFAEAKGLVFHLFRLADKHKIVLKSVSRRNTFAIDVERSPVVQFSLGHWNTKENIFSRGRLYYEKSYYEGNQSIVKDENFIASAEKLFAWFRRNYKNVKTPPYDHLKGFIVSPSVANLVKERAMTLV